MPSKVYFDCLDHVCLPSTTAMKTNASQHAKKERTGNYSFSPFPESVTSSRTLWITTLHGSATIDISTTIRSYGFYN